MLDALANFITSREEDRIDAGIAHQRLAGLRLTVNQVDDTGWKAGLLEKLGATWTIIGLVIAIGIGIMIAVTSSGQKSIVEVDEKKQ